MIIQTPLMQPLEVVGAACSTSRQGGVKWSESLDPDQDGSAPERILDCGSAPRVNRCSFALELAEAKQAALAAFEARGSDHTHAP